MDNLRIFELAFTKEAGTRVNTSGFGPFSGLLESAAVGNWDTVDRPIGRVTFALDGEIPELDGSQVSVDSRLVIREGTDLVAFVEWKERDKS